MSEEYPDQFIEGVFWTPNEDGSLSMRVIGSNRKEAMARAEAALAQRKAISNGDSETNI
jgi:hypothetical protein